MRRGKIQYIAALTLVGVVLVYLFGSAFQSAVQYYVTLDELYAAPPSPERTLRVAGYVQKESLRHVGSATMTHHFLLEQQGKTLPVRYTGLLPDTFHEGGEVVATGHLLADGSFQASGILAKCASKYEAGPTKE